MRLTQALVIAGSCLPLCAQAAIRVEPDDFPNLTPLSDAVAGVTLTLSQPDGEIRADFTVFSLSGFGHSSTGRSVFGAGSSTGEGPLFNYFGGNLRADFASPMKSVSIDFIGCCDVPNDPLTVGLLRAFDSSGALVGSYTTAPLHENSVETATITLATAGIARVQASATDTANATYLDNFFASPVPEPANAWLLGSGLITMAGLFARRKRSSTRQAESRGAAGQTL